jgi:hypothetical protein
VIYAKHSIIAFKSNVCVIDTRFKKFEILSRISEIIPRKKTISKFHLYKLLKYFVVKRYRIFCSKRREFGKAVME